MAKAHIQTGHFYPLYNRGNNYQKVFFERKNYLYFLRLCLDLEIFGHGSRRRISDRPPLQTRYCQVRAIAASRDIAVAMCNVAEASQNAYPALAFDHPTCPKCSDQSYILGLSLPSGLSARLNTFHE
jgi:hypothetical protein